MRRINDYVTREMVRRKVQFHPAENWQSIKIWGLFYKSDVRWHLKNGWLIPVSNYGFRCLGWYYPSREYWESSIEPLITETQRSCENCRKCGETICGNDTEGIRCWEG